MAHILPLTTEDSITEAFHTTFGQYALLQHTEAKPLCCIRIENRISKVYRIAVRDKIHLLAIQESSRKLISFENLDQEVQVAIYNALLQLESLGYLTSNDVLLARKHTLTGSRPVIGSRVILNEFTNKVLKRTAPARRHEEIAALLRDMPHAGIIGSHSLHTALASQSSDLQTLSKPVSPSHLNKPLRAFKEDHPVFSDTRYSPTTHAILKRLLVQPIRTDELLRRTGSTRKEYLLAIKEEAIESVVIKGRTHTQVSSKLTAKYN